MNHSIIRLLTVLGLMTLKTAHAQTIPNPSFEAESFFSGVGYAGQNGGVITGWTISNTNRIGLNLGGTNNPTLFANNGVIPNGTNVAFVQSTGSGNSLATTISGLTVGVNYLVSFRANCRSSFAAPAAAWQINGGGFTAITASPAVGGANAYYTNSATFTATATTASLVISNNTASDSTLLVDNFTVAQLPTTLGYWRMGEDDPGAVPGVMSFTSDSAGNRTLTAVGGPFYQNVASSAAAMLTGSRLSLWNFADFDGTGTYATNSAIAGITNNFAIELWVNPNSATGNHCLAYNGNPTNNGWGLYQVGATYQGRLGGVGFVGSAPMTANTWVHLALVRNNGVTTLYTNGVPAGSTSAANPIAASGRFSVGATSAGQEAVQGYIDEVRIFTFSGGTFSTNDLLYGPPIATTLAATGVTTNSARLNGSVNPAKYASGYYFQYGYTTNYFTDTPAVVVAATSPPLAVSNSLSGLLPGTLYQFRVVVTNALGTNYGANQTFTTGGTTLFVSNPNDSGAGSLRQAILNAAALGGSQTVTIVTNFTAPVILASEIVINSDLTVDARTNGGVTISGNNSNRIFSVNGGTVVLRNLTLTRGNGVGLFNNGSGGAILNYGDLTLIRCTIASNHMTSASGGTAAIRNQNNLALIHCTVSGNTDDSVFDSGAIYNLFGNLTLSNSIVSGNTASQHDSAGDILNAGGIVNFTGKNIVRTILDISGGTTFNIGSRINKYPLLAPLGDYGGNCLTMTPLSFSPARYATLIQDYSAGPDQRGLTRSTYQADIGACQAMMGNFYNVTTYKDTPTKRVIFDNFKSTVPTFLSLTSSVPSLVSTNMFGYYISPNRFVVIAPAPGQTGTADITVTDNNNGEKGFFTFTVINTPVVTNRADSGPGTLRQIVTNINNAASYGGSLHGSGQPIITFSPSVFTSGSNTIVLNSEIPIGQPLTLDARAVGGVTISGGGSNRLFSTSAQEYVYEDHEVQFCAITFTGGNSRGNFTDLGGAIYNLGDILSLIQCTFASNTASNGGAIYHENDNNNSRLFLNHCTFSGNTASNGGAIFNVSACYITNSIVADNRATMAGGDIYNMRNVTRAGANIIQSLFNSPGSDSGPAAINTSPLLSPLGSHGGGAQTMRLFPDSPARNAAVGSAITNDQRGFPILGTPDIGAFESQLGPTTNATLYMGGPGATLPFNVGFIGTLSATSSVPSLVSNPALGGSGSSRNLTVVPATNSYGNAVVYVTDSLSGEQQTFNLAIIGPVVASTANSGSGSLRQVLADNLNYPGLQTITFDPSVFTNGCAPISLTNEITLSTNLIIDASGVGGVTISGNNLTRIFYLGNNIAVTLRGLTLTGGNGSGTLNPGFGGAIFNYYNNSNFTLVNCTLTGNSADSGGAITSIGLMNLNHCTIAGNTANYGGGVGTLFGLLNLTNSIVAGNTANISGGDIYADYSTIVRGGANIVQSQALLNSSAPSGPAAINANPLLSAPGNYGGAALTRKPLPGSPAINAAVTTTLSKDQRGYPRVSGDAPDIGALELQYAASNNPPVLKNISRNPGSGTAQLSFTNLPGGNFSILASTNVATPLNLWSNLGSAVENPVGSGNFQFTDTAATNKSQSFYRVSSP